jgi:hypothetical protein
MEAIDLNDGIMFAAMMQEEAAAGPAGDGHLKALSCP